MCEAQWDQLRMDDRIAGILRDAESHSPAHHFGRPFLSAYQIAIRFSEEHPDEFTQIGLPIGGRGTGQHNSLTQYIANHSCPN